jgi:small subunit ribosomal protein S9
MARKKKSEPEADEQDTSPEGTGETAAEEAAEPAQEAQKAEAAQAPEAPAQEVAPGEAAQAAEAPQPETPQAEVPQEEAPQAEVPQAEVPQAEVPQAEAPHAEDAQREAAQADAPQPELAQADEGAGAEASEAPAGVPASVTADASEGEEEATGEAGERPARAKPSVPGAHLEVDIVPEGVDPLGRSEEYEDPYAIEEDERAPAETEEEGEEAEEVLTQPIASAAIDLAAGARYHATGKRKTAIARVTLRPGNGTYLINGRTLEEHFPRMTLQRNIRQPLETVGYHERMDVLGRLQGGGISAQAGALRHGVSRALLEADPNLRGELKRRGFLTRDSRAKERKKAGLKKARKRPQFSKR